MHASDREDSIRPVELVAFGAGVGLMIAGLVATSTWLVVVGLLVGALGAVLPVRTLWRRVTHARMIDSER